MNKKIQEVSESIKSKLSFDDYKASENKDIKTEENKEVKTSTKVKRTFYLNKEIVDKLDEFYARKLTEKNKVDKSDIVMQALENLFEQGNIDIKTY